MTGKSHIPEELLAEMTPAVRAFVDTLSARITALEERIDVLEALNERLRLQVKQLTPQNSSLPPSSQHPHAKAPNSSQTKKTKQKRKRGGQRGHPRCQRPLIPSEECAQIIPCLPVGCRRCGHTFSTPPLDPNPLRHQVWDVEIRPVVTEYQQHRQICEHCGTSTCGQLPETVRGGTGSVLTAMLVLLTSCYRVSRKKAADFAEQVCGVPCSAAHVSDLEGRTQSLLHPACQELVDATPADSHLKIDETPYRRGSIKTWLWTIVAAQFTVFRLAATRKRCELTSIIGDMYGGVIHCDRAKMYLGFEKLQWCWAHLKRAGAECP